MIANPRDTEASQPAADFRQRASVYLRSNNLTVLGLVVTLLALGVAFTATSPYFLSVDNLLNVGRAVALNGVIAIGLTICLLGGGLDLSIASVMAASSMFLAALLLEGTPEGLAIVATLAFGASLGSINGVAVTRLRLNPIICTLGTMSIIRGLAYVVNDGSAISVGLDTFAFLGRGSVSGIPVPVFILAGVAALGYFVLRYTVFGHYVLAIGGNAEACRVSGVRVDFWRFWTYIVSAASAAGAGVLLVSLTGYGSPIAGVGAELDIITAVILGGIGLTGGRGGIVGTMLGVAILGVLNNGMVLLGIPLFYQLIVRGSILVFAVTLDTRRSGGGYR